MVQSPIPTAISSGSPSKSFGALSFAASSSRSPSCCLTAIDQRGQHGEDGLLGRGPALCQAHCRDAVAGDWVVAGEQRLRELGATVDERYEQRKVEHRRSPVVVVEGEVLGARVRQHLVEEGFVAHDHGCLEEWAEVASVPH